MDDPTLGLDTAVRHQFLEGMIALILHEGRTVFFSSHILTDVERVCDRLVVIDKGVLKANCSLEQFRKAIKKVRLSFAGSAPDQVEITGLLHCRRSEKELELVLVGTSDEQITEWVAKATALKHQTIKMTLEDQFIEFTAPSAPGRLFDWETI
jgi:ABC-2 type transport system ATP-binding protein